MIIPGTTKELINVLIKEYHYSIEDIAHAIKSNQKTLLRILEEGAVLPKTSLNLLVFYLQVKTLEAKKEKKYRELYKQTWRISRWAAIEARA